MVELDTGLMQCMSDFDAGQNADDSIEAPAVYHGIAVRAGYERWRRATARATPHQIAGGVEAHLQTRIRHASRQPFARLRVQRREGTAGPGALWVSELCQ